ncbi:Ctr copper transporter [Laetiporus sulphureus 93-53]|uniref:Copper transport protein n=1 Tax=Laetiporus sulphureus 93-53 TaxID=1314785 RepID=A0A165GUA2_9APHY|nr:Ctr copper transporter [Laetiporus sulphureus 93-53]KZT10821.1 Ctr copper transporter [Laetiporus sulphureus 93-53]
MDHGGHDMPMGPKCSMNMLWNTQIEDTCVVFRSWHISSKTAFAFSFLAILALGVLYEWLRVAQRDVDRLIARRLLADGKGKARVPRSGRNTPESDSEGAGLLTGLPSTKPIVGTPLPLLPRIIRAVLYGLTVFLSFFLMLVFMTYNAYLIMAVVFGAAIGHFIFGSHMDINAALSVAVDGKGMACH